MQNEIQLFELKNKNFTTFDSYDSIRVGNSGDPESVDIYSFAIGGDGQKYIYHEQGEHPELWKIEVCELEDESGNYYGLSDFIDYTAKEDYNTRKVDIEDVVIWE